MSDDAKSLPFQAAREVDRICDEFESQIQAGKQPRIEDILAGSTEIDRNHLLQSLLRVELELLGRQSQLSPQNSYEKRFPQDLEIVRRAFSEWRKKSAGTEPGNQTRIGNAPRRKETVSLNNPAVESSRIGVRKKQSSENPDLETFGKFQVKRVLGKGGFGTVYHAYDPQLDRDVAVKVPLLSSLDTPELLERFLREARATATLRHANICPVYEIGELDQQPYIVMAFIQGLPLSAFINPDKPLTERQVAIIIRKVALALETAHRENVIHRDIKPDNIMIDRKSKEPVVMDFGLARRDSSQDTHLTQEGQIMGTPIYMPPEQAKGEVDKIGPRSDIYSLGVILYEMLSCERPFKGSIAEVLGAIVRDEPDPPSQHRPDLDPTMEAICLKAMAKKPEDRYQSMAELAQALGDFLKGTGTSGENAVVESGENANKKTEEPAGLTA
ncbi:MAG: serine/threonine protein kinase, partial [Planctomycetaceae bacterium]|nr:serine/threonine protein kinase [Planctomycetaceae bacterium]